MKNIKILIASFLMLGIGFLISSCEAEKYSLGNTPDKSEIDFEIVQDFTADSGGNTVIMTNNTDGVILTWNYGTGKSNKKVETVKYAFKGDYTIYISAVTAGGIVELDPVTITVTDDNLSYVDDPLWTALSGGVGHSKTWYLDLNADGESKYFGAPMSFSGNELVWDKECEGNPDDGLCWIWEPEWAGNEWIADAGDYGSMTFSLEGGPFINVNHALTTNRGEENGTYFLDADAKTLTLTDAAILQNSWGDNDVNDWSNYRILTLTEDAMQLAAFHNSKEELVIFNFISKEYSDNWVAEDLPDPNPAIDLNGGTVDDLLSVTSTTSKTWSLSPDTPFNWTDLNGTFLNDWNSVEDYPDWAAYTPDDQVAVVNNKITFNDDGTVTTIDSNGNEAEGTYITSTDGTNVITFTDITPVFPVGSSLDKVSTTANNEWKIIKTGLTGTTVTDVWFGKRDEVKSEYMVFHFVLEDPNADPNAEVKAILTGNTWKIDSNRTYDTTIGGIAVQGPAVYSDFASWSWNPLPGEQYAAGDVGVDYGDMTFNIDGTMVVNQLTDSGSVTLNGTWSVSDGELTITAEMLHPWTADYAVADWTAIRTFKIEPGALLLQAERDAALSGEDAFWITWIFVPGV
ncbi:hypothetical protein [Thalassobellus suaedae]|uniref:PKD domain-containing protein n=1 Tax=Thalassobellus suaedae TaxID=3074124 RepID=A0ABY9Y073_9FLAO|nr:hypothetical protein RHP49_11380 [Flavobacteriaceae bacterium HL-DH10]